MYRSDQKGTEGTPERWSIVELVELGRREAKVSPAYLWRIFGKWYRSGNGKGKGVINDNERQFEGQLMTILGYIVWVEKAIHR